MKLWIDADAAPRLGYKNLSAVRVDGGPDVADLCIAEHAEEGDVAITADIPLAALLVPKHRALTRARRFSMNRNTI